MDIQPGSITDISLAPLVTTLLSNKNKVQDYVLSFRVTNELSTSSLIRVQFPQAFRIVNNVLFKRVFVVQGLEDKSADDPILVTVKVDAVDNYIQLSNYKATPANSRPPLLTMHVRMVNPNQQGMTTPLQISSYGSLQLTPLIDQDLYTARTHIEDFPAGNMFDNLSGLVVSSAVADSSSCDIQMQIKPSAVFPASGFIQLRLHPDFSLNIDPATFSATQCKVCIKTSSCTFHSG